MGHCGGLSGIRNKTSARWFAFGMSLGDADGTALAIGRFPHAGKGLRTINEMAKVKAAGAGNFFARSGDTVLRMDAGREQDGSEHSKDCASQVHVRWTRSREIRYRLYHRLSGDNG